MIIASSNRDCVSDKRLSLKYTTKNSIERRTSLKCATRLDDSEKTVGIHVHVMYIGLYNLRGNMFQQLHRAVFDSTVPAEHRVHIACLRRVKSCLQFLWEIQSRPIDSGNMKQNIFFYER